MKSFQDFTLITFLFSFSFVVWNHQWEFCLLFSIAINLLSKTAAFKSEQNRTGDKSTEMFRQQIPLRKERERKRKKVHLTEANFLNIFISFPCRNFLTSSRKVSQTCCEDSRVEGGLRDCSVLPWPPCQTLSQGCANAALSSSNSPTCFSLLTWP